MTLVEPMGSDTQITGRSGDAEIVVLFHRRITAMPGDTLHVQPTERHRFDTANGRRM